MLFRSFWDHLFIQRDEQGRGNSSWPRAEKLVASSCIWCTHIFSAWLLTVFKFFFEPIFRSWKSLHKTPDLWLLLKNWPCLPRWTEFLAGGNELPPALCPTGSQVSQLCSLIFALPAGTQAASPGARWGARCLSAALMRAHQRSPFSGGTRSREKAPRIDCLGLNLLAVWPWASVLTSVHFSVLATD